MSDGSSPIVATDSIFMTGVIDAKEMRAIAILVSLCTKAHRLVQHGLSSIMGLT